MVIGRMIITLWHSMKTIDQLKAEKEVLQKRREKLQAKAEKINEELVSLYDRIKDLSEKIFEDEALHTEPSGQISLMLRYEWNDSNYKAAKKFFESHALSRWVSFRGGYNPNTLQWSIQLMFDEDSKYRLNEIAQYIDEIAVHLKAYDGDKLFCLLEPSLSEHQSYRVALTEDGKWQLQGYRFSKTVLKQSETTLDMVQYLQQNYSFKKD